MVAFSCLKCCVTFEAYFVLAEFAAAQIVGKLDPRSKESFTIYACAAVTFLCSCV